MTKYVLRSSLLSLLLLGSVSAAQERTKTAQAIKDAVSCNEFVTPLKQADSSGGGIEQCQVISEQSVFNINGHRYRRVEIRLSGAVAGWVPTQQGLRSAYFTDGPDFVFAQSGLTGPRARGIGRYEAATGHGMTLLYPENPRQWNGKLYMNAHGAGSYGAVGTLIPRDPNLKFNPLQGVNRYVSTMMDEGYAVAQTMRSSDRLKGDVTVTLEDGTKATNFNLSSHAGLLVDWTKLAQNFVVRRIGSAPKRTYFYGHSAGGFLGRLINYQPGANLGPDGKPVFDGFLVDDAGGGLWLPKLMVDGKDVLFTTDEARQRFAKQIDVSHALYAGETQDYLHNKRENARLLRAKGLGPKHRMYEIRGVSHFDAGQVSRSDLVHQNLDLGGLFAALITRLDLWVEKDIRPAPTKSDLADLADLDRDGVVENHAVAFPEVACPLGVYHIFPAALNPGRRGGQETGFAPFDGINLEPLDGRGVFVDMNGNGVRDKRESVTQAWQRLGLLQNGQRFSQSVYVGCVKTAAGKLVKEGLLPKRIGEAYAEQAARMRLPAQGPTN